MIASIRINGKHKIGVSGNGYIDVNGTKISIKDIPFVRFRFKEYGYEEVKYIKDTIEKFPKSTPLAEVMLSDNTSEDVNRIRESIPNIAIFVYLEVWDEDVANADEEDDDFEYDLVDTLATQIEQCEVDKVCLIDKSTTLNFVNAKKLIEQYSSFTGFDEEDFSICCSPLSLREYGCLTAVKARELMAKYSKDDDVPLPTANHQKGCCGCIQYINIESDCMAPVDKKASAKSSEGNKSTDRKAPTQKKKSKGIAFGQFKF